MGHLLVGDGHYCGAPGEAEAWSALLARAEERGLTELSILGDFLELWVGLPGLEAPWHEPLFAPLRRLRERGVHLNYVVGNKDYFVEEWNERHGLFHRIVDGSVELASPLGRLVLAHGDLVNRRDRQYRTWRALSRSAPVRALAHALPRAQLARLAEHMAAKLRDTNRYHKSYFPEAELRARADELGPGKALVVFGHFHVFRRLEQGDKTIITLPFLGGETAGVWLDERGAERYDGQARAVQEPKP